jgi:hypothetical protein
MSDVTLKKGIWFIYQNNDNDVRMGTILDIRKDPDTEVHWFKCRMFYDIWARRTIDGESVISSSDFERFQSLETFEEEQGKEILKSYLERDERAEQLLAVEQARDDTDPHDEDEPTLQAEEFDPPRARVAMAYDHTEIPLGSGEMKSILKLYEANPRYTWQTIDNIIQSTGHLLLTYTNNDLRQKIVQNKIDYLLNRNWVKFQDGKMYKMEYNGEITIAVYFSSNWVTSPRSNNNIAGLRGNALTFIHEEDLRNFKIETVSESDYSQLYQNLKNTINHEIDKSELYDPFDNIKILCRTDEFRAKIPAKEIERNWQKAFVYNYYISGNLDPRLDLANFQDSAAIRSMAEIKKDSVVLEALAA